ncbi:hypothetical protein CEUSTIGMA_g7279.t1 [Chlamydomonas eustigma]|uniref:O-phosphoseryl-tRNA(Sec) selenium transferase n=1 Tax=Chlamydomonas eustigma TaxID=1157962 RepID=A0A250XAB8_9CHLO|nr:hypothetical protein CEUSTIGMA_g7279.t1 [Chlamydomonas eustigma]|eukprot:GAX79839.1 hypothetical protein CEUSTIGMA_g7279.t1 [Chlamydomonas eustigma]
MNKGNCDLACGLISRSYIMQGQQALAKRQKQVKALLSSRRLPEEGWDEQSIEMFIQDLSMMDSNNFVGNVGVGEREARVACPLVARRHYHLAHGIGRSGDVAAEQPKAAGSSLLAKITSYLAQDALDLAGMHDLGAVTVLPLATGMSITLTLLAIRQQYLAQPQDKAFSSSLDCGKSGLEKPNLPSYVIWSRIDQKTCLKSIDAAGFKPVVVELLPEGDQLLTDVKGIQQKLEELGPSNVACVVTTTSCFAPRAPDDVVAVAKLCEAAGVAHVINNAYGVQSSQICALITAAWRKGRVDAVIQSTDKNFMVPVGGTIVVAGKRRPGLVEGVNKVYPGRAAVNAHVDLLMTLLHWGARGWRQVLQGREDVLPYLRECLEKAAETVGERVLVTPNNPISMAMTLNKLQQQVGDQKSTHRDATFLGSMLWSRFISGTRVVPKGKKQSVAGIDFLGYGSHADDYPHVYLTAAAAIGTKRGECLEFVDRLIRAYQEYELKYLARSVEPDANSSETH